jgi:4-amino-4-deoxy-L-arabinose transferase-like glycosyltransferase
VNATIRAAGTRVAELIAWQSDTLLERRICRAIVLLTPVWFLLFLALAPALNPTYDDAKYVGIGRNFLAGNGPVTVFGEVFLKHSPLWPMLIALPERIVGIPAITIARLLNAGSAAVMIALVGYLGWQVRPAIGAIAAVILAANPYTFAIARTAGIDLPSIALTFAYIALGFVVMRRRSVGLAAVLGAVFAIAFLIKETILPFAPVPFLMGVVWGVPWKWIFRSGAATLGVAAIGTSWWFLLYASYAHSVYRADFPEWTLIPIAAGTVVLVALGFAAGGWSARLPDRFEARARALIGWGGTAAWLVFLCVFFARTPKLLGAGLFDREQFVQFLRHLDGSIRFAFAFGLGGVLLVIELVRDRGRVTPAGVGLLIATICGIPLVLLVQAVGETPRHYFAEVGLLILVGASGWYHGLLRLRERDRPAIVLLIVLAVAALIPTIGANLVRLSALRLTVAAIGALVAIGATVVGLRWLHHRGRLAVVGTVIAAVLFVGAVGTGGVRAIRLRGVIDANQTTATAGTVSWIAGHVQPGETIALGPYLSMETSIDLPAGVRAILLRHYLAAADPAAPLGLRSAGGPDDDVIAIDLAPGKANQFNVYSANQLRTAILSNHVSYYIYPITRARSSKSILKSLVPENGFELIDTQTYRGRTDTIDVFTFRVDPAKVTAPTAIYVTPDALARLVDRLTRDPAEGAAAAKTLAERIVPPDDGSEDTMITELRTLAAPLESAP